MILRFALLFSLLGFASSAAAQTAFQEAGQLLQSGQYQTGLLKLEDSCGLEGNAEACSLAARIHYGGQAGTVDKAQARHFFREGCAGPHPASCFALADMQSKGEGGAVDADASVMNFRTACDAGLAPACERVAAIDAKIAQDRLDAAQLISSGTVDANTLASELKPTIVTGMETWERSCSNWKKFRDEPLSTKARNKLFNVCTNLISTSGGSADQLAAMPQTSAVRLEYQTAILFQGYAHALHAEMLMEIESHQYLSVNMPGRICSDLTSAKTLLEEASPLRKTALSDQYMGVKDRYDGIRTRANCS